MKQELEEKLYTKYPKLFKERGLPMTQTCMCWGCFLKNDILSARHYLFSGG